MTASDAQLVRSIVESVVAPLHSAIRRQTRSIARTLSLLEFYVRPGRGRPRDPRITLAATMHAEGKKWREIYRICLRARATYASADEYRQAKDNLRKAVQQRSDARPTTPSPDRVSSRKTIPPIQ